MDFSPFQLSLISSLIILPNELIYAYFTVYILDIKKPWIIYLLNLIAWTVNLLAPLDSSGIFSAISIAFIFIFYRFLIPYLLSTKPRTNTILLICSTFVAMMLSAGVACLISFLVYQGEVTVNAMIERPAIVLLIKLFQTAALILSFSAIDVFDKRLRKKQQDGVIPLWATALPLSQCALAIMAALFYSSHHVYDAAGLILPPIVFVLTAVIDIVFFTAYRAWIDEQTAAIQADAIMDETNQQQKSQEQYVAMVENVSKLRHDFANQVQVIKVLCEEGNAAEARQHLQSMKHLLTKGSPKDLLGKSQIDQSNALPEEMADGMSCGGPR